MDYTNFDGMLGSPLLFALRKTEKGSFGHPADAVMMYSGQMAKGDFALTCVVFLIVFQRVFSDFLVVETNCDVMVAHALAPAFWDQI